MESPSLKVFKKQLDMALHAMVYLARWSRLDFMILEILLLFCESVLVSARD